jgi:hypothetical protein
VEQERKGGRISRRKALIGLALAGGAAAAAAGYGLTNVLKRDEEAATEPALRSVFIGEPVPLKDPASPLWRRAEAQKIALQGQAVAMPLKPQPSVQAVTVRSLHDGESIAFRLEWDDADKEEHTIKSDQFRDACGVLFGAEVPLTGVPHPIWMMGSPDDPVTIIHWKADWQLDIDKGFQDLEVAFPNVAFDFYPPLVGVTNPRIPDDYPEEARHWLPGWAAGNPMSLPVKSTPVEKLLGLGPGTVDHLPTQNADGRGVWNEGRWTVVLGRPLTAADPQEISLEPAGNYSVAFGVWSGDERDRGARKSLTNLGRLSLDSAS